MRGHPSRSRGKALLFSSYFAALKIWGAWQRVWAGRRRSGHKYCQWAHSVSRETYINALNLEWANEGDLNRHWCRCSKNNFIRSSSYLVAFVIYSRIKATPTQTIMVFSLFDYFYINYQISVFSLLNSFLFAFDIFVIYKYAVSHL